MIQTSSILSSQKSGLIFLYIKKFLERLKLNRCSEITWRQQILHSSEFVDYVAVSSQVVFWWFFFVIVMKHTILTIHY